MKLDLSPLNTGRKLGSGHLTAQNIQPVPNEKKQRGVDAPVGTGGRDDTPTVPSIVPLCSDNDFIKITDFVNPLNIKNNYSLQAAAISFDF